ncbi:MAG: sensor of ECF-type sigma factor [Burkholderiales bacterium]|nr:sensor of ECF-type sigma factor [Flavobacterium sp.]
MKPNKILVLFLLLISVNLFAQPKREQLKSLKVAYITDQLQLTSDEATKFWPLYNAFESKQKELRQDKLRAYMDRLDGGEVEKMSDKDALNFLNQMENTEEEIYQRRKKFITNLKSVLAPVKIIKLKRAEEGFNRKLLKQYRDKFSKD